jgi:hypothetical protein
LLLCIASLCIASCSIAGAADLGNLTSYLRARNLEIKQFGAAIDPFLEIGDTVTFGIVPAGLVKSELTAGQPLKWRVVAIESGTVVDGSATSEDAASLVLVLDEGSLGIRPVNRFETCMPLQPLGNDPWTQSELSAWLNSSATGPNGIDFSLGNNSIEGFGLLETAFSSEIIAILLPVSDTPADQTVVVPLATEFLSWGIETPEATITRNAGIAPYTLQALTGTQLSNLKVNETGRVVPVIRVNTATLESAANDYFESVSYKETLDVPTIYRQPVSVMTSISARASQSELASVGAAVESMSIEEREAAPEHLKYQWYQLIEGASQPIPVDASTGLATEDGQARPGSEAATLEGSLITEVGRYVFYCQIIHDDGQARSGVNSAAIVISISASQEASLKCSDCHSSNIRTIHRGIEGREGGYCSVCHRRAPQGWADNRIPEKGFTDFNISCGLNDAECHGSSASAPWHGEDLQAEHAVSYRVEVGDPASGKAVKKEYAQLKAAQGDPLFVAANSCSGGVYSTGCHALNSSESSFYFGAMNLMTVHNDYAKAQATGGALVRTKALGSSGCTVCHEMDRRPDPIKDRDCSSCHVKGNGSYFEQAATASNGSACFKPVSPKDTAAKKLAATATTSDKPQAAPPVSVSLAVQQLVGTLIGTPLEAEPLEAGVVAPATMVMPAGTFPLGSLLEGASPLSN